MYIQRLFIHGLLTKEMYDGWIQRYCNGCHRSLEESQILERNSRVIPLLFFLFILTTFLFKRQVPDTLFQFGITLNILLLLIEYLMYAAIVGTALLWITQKNWKKCGHLHTRLRDDCLKLDELLKTMIGPKDRKIIEGIKGLKNKVNMNFIALHPVGLYAHSDMKEVFRRIMYSRIDPRCEGIEEIYRTLVNFGFMSESWDQYLTNLDEVGRG